MTQPIRWLKTPRGPIERRAHLFEEHDRRSFCHRQTIPAAVTFHEMIEVIGGEFGPTRCVFCWRLR